ncbi:hypothetical protein K438DRAFT_1749443 [Mycena galopus ATCC 62051]|nr:hypothetical protein K438DRAFT_1749443 [Mycena galopus ATCC 62051]
MTHGDKPNERGSNVRRAVMACDGPSTPPDTPDSPFSSTKSIPARNNRSCKNLSPSYPVNGRLFNGLRPTNPSRRRPLFSYRKQRRNGPATRCTDPVEPARQARPAALALLEEGRGRVETGEERVEKSAVEEMKEGTIRTCFDRICWKYQMGSTKISAEGPQYRGIGKHLRRGGREEEQAAPARFSRSTLKAHGGRGRRNKLKRTHEIGGSKPNGPSPLTAFAYSGSRYGGGQGFVKRVGRKGGG